MDECKPLGGGSSDSHSDDSDVETEEQQLQRAMVQSLSLLRTPASFSPLTAAAANTAVEDDEDAEEEDAEDTDDEEEWREDDAAENGWTWGTGAGAYTHPRLSSTSAVLVTPLLVPLSNRLGENHAYPTKCASVEPKGGRV